jgi:hypothetical protein
MLNEHDAELLRGLEAVRDALMPREARRRVASVA